MYKVYKVTKLLVQLQILHRILYTRFTIHMVDTFTNKFIEIEIKLIEVNILLIEVNVKLIEIN